MTTKSDLSSIQSITARDLLLRNFPDRHMVIDPWLRTGETAIIWAASGVGKTMLCLSVALAVAGGGHIADWKAPQARKVVYIDGEMNLQDIRDRIRGLSEQVGISPKHLDKALERMTIIARQAQEVGTGFYDLTCDKTQEEIIRLIQRQEPDLVIFDNFTTLTDDLDDENDATAFKRVQDFFLQMKKLNTATILVHHANKSGKDYRGSTALETTFEVVLGLERPKVFTPGQAKFNAAFRKFRGKGDGRTETRTMTLTDEGWDFSEALPDDPNDDPVLHALKTFEYTSQAEIAKALGMDKSTVSRRIKRLETIGVLKEREWESLLANAKKMKDFDDNDYDDAAVMTEEAF